MLTLITIIDSAKSEIADICLFMVKFLLLLLSVQPKWQYFCLVNKSVVMN